VQALLVSERQITVADEEKLNLKTDDANFPWGIGGTSTKLLVSNRERLLSRHSLGNVFDS